MANSPKVTSILLFPIFEIAKNMPIGSLEVVHQALEFICPLMNNSRSHLNGLVADNSA
jgi:hypothetical protein